MLAGERSSETPKSMVLWKRLILIGLSIGASIVIAGAGIVWAVYRYQNRPIPPTTWEPRELPQVGVEAWLKSEWRDGSLRYQFRISPLSPELAEAFHKVARSSSQKTFTVVFYDEGGFKLCGYEVTTGPEVDSSGRVAALVSNDSTWLCSAGKYRQATAWNLSYVFPKLIARKKTPRKTSSRPVKRRKDDKDEKSTVRQGDKKLRTEIEADYEDGIKATSLSGTDSLTGFDYMSCRMETRSGHTFLLYRPGECTTALQWRVSARLRYTCKTKRDCLVENLGNDQAVHARLLK